MGLVYTDITLKNSGDVQNVGRGFVKEAEVREVAVNALVDTGSGTLVISEEIRQKLGLAITGLRRSELADGTKQVYQVTEPVDVHWKNRETSCRALVVPHARTVLLGAIPLEDMDLIVNPGAQELSGAHGDEPLCLIMSFVNNCCEQ
ncbi:MAG: clan AA aspartic protease [Spirochaetaceae bacterium]|jgi:clan AA aspartic protease|nr:clan AA aspartic protease [Spirochaetaceae bacterium]